MVSRLLSLQASLHAKCDSEREKIGKDIEGKRSKKGSCQERERKEKEKGRGEKERIEVTL